MSAISPTYAPSVDEPSWLCPPLNANAVTTAKLHDSAVTHGKLPAGCVLQVVNAYDNTLRSTTNTNFLTPTTFLSATITPTSTSSKILISGHIVCGGSASGIGVNLSLLAGGSLVPQAELGADENGLLTYGFGRADGVQSCYSFEHLDSPATTSSYTYALGFARYGGSGTAYVGWNNNKDRTSLTLMEIAQ